MLEENKLASLVIAELNDQLRSCIPLLPPPHILILTQGVQALHERLLAELFEKVKTFSEFNKSNDVYGERNFGTVSVERVNYFWKYDFYDETYSFYKPNGNRVLTLMRADEY
jgi:hypothetical protein